jgi:K+-transporting ATPase A subunit
MEWSLALNSAISFLTSTDLQHYSGETGATYLSQIAVFMFLQFVSAATSLATGIAVVRGLARKSTADLGNFYKRSYPFPDTGFASPVADSSCAFYAQRHADDF